MRIKKTIIVLAFLLVAGLIGNIIDKHYFMNNRILSQKLWEHSSGDYSAGDFLCMEYAKMNSDTLVLDYSNGSVFLFKVKYQRFNTLKLTNLKTKKDCYYTMKGANWLDFLFKRKK